MPNNPLAALAALAPLFGGAMTPAQTAPAQAPSAPSAPATGRQEVKVTHAITAFKSTSGFNKDRWIMSAGDLSCPWSSTLVPKSAFVKMVSPTTGKTYMATKTKFEVTFGISGSGRVYGISAVDTREPVGTGETLDDIGAEETLDNVETTSTEKVAETL